jgi:hypothetical protein
MTARARPPNRRAAEPRPTFVLRIEGKPGTAIRSLRWLLKTLLRRHHLKCLDLREDRPTP